MERIKYIDGLRAIAVLAVIFYHFGYLPNGYFGVDVFFVISGFLITGLIYSECKEKHFSIKRFYVRRIRRILPLVSFVTFFSLVIGIFVMLPDDLENLAESSVATTLFSNNILQAITTRDYWNVANEYKPLLHTWSLGIEEQYYFLYPILFLLLSAKRLRFILPVLISLTVISLVLYFIPVFSSSAKFYYLPFRFFELSCGGLLSVLLKDGIINRKNTFLSLICLSIVVLILLVNIKIIPNMQLCLIVLGTCGIILFTKDGKNISCIILQNKPIVYIGMISFSLYMWHQCIIAFARYFVLFEVTVLHSVIMFIITFITAIVSYYFIEQPFRDKKRISEKFLFSILIPVNCVILVFSLFLYTRSGVIKDVPELNITTKNITRGLHAAYNDRGYSYDHDFMKENKIHILVVGDSLARDFINILLESKWNDKIEISYVFDIKDIKLTTRMGKADLIFLSTIDRNELNIPENVMNKLFCIGTKSFGNNAGIFYNYRGEGYYMQRTSMKKGIVELNNHLKKQYGNEFIDLIGYIVDDKKTVPVFTPDKKFISQDCIHLTKAGAEYFARLLESDVNFILNKIFTN